MIISTTRIYLVETISLESNDENTLRLRKHQDFPCCRWFTFIGSSWGSVSVGRSLRRSAFLSSEGGIFIPIPVSEEGVG